MKIQQYFNSFTLFLSYLDRYSGTHCEHDSDDCESANCQNNGTCIDMNAHHLCGCASYGGYFGDS